MFLQSSILFYNQSINHITSIKQYMKLRSSLQNYEHFHQILPKSSRQIQQYRENICKKYEEKYTSHTNRKSNNKIKMIQINASQPQGKHSHNKKSHKQQTNEEICLLQLNQKSINLIESNQHLTHSLIKNRYQMSSQSLRNKLSNEKISIEKQGQNYQNVSTARPLTESKARKVPNQRVYLYSPLEVIKTKYQSSDLASQNQTKSKVSFQRYTSPVPKCRSVPLKIKTTFLKKGTAINRSIILNILKSKINPNTCGSSFNYTNYKGNEKLEQIIKEQIPVSLRDIVGAQEMLRMSHVFTGQRIRCINMTQKINKILIHKIRNQGKVHTQMQGADQEKEENMTLKSIKRW